MGKHKKLKIVLIVLAVIIAATSIYVAVFNSRATKELNKVIAIADKFQPPSDWRLTQNVERKQSVTGCIDVECPGVFRRFSFEGQNRLNIEEIVKSINQKIEVFNSELDCQMSQRNTGDYIMCSTNFVNNSYNISVVLRGNNEKGVNELTISAD